MTQIVDPFVTLSPTLTLSLNYPNSTWTEKTIKITVESNYKTTANYPATSTIDPRISQYDDILGYQIIGKDSETEISIEDLIEITATKTDKTSIFLVAL